VEDPRRIVQARDREVAGFEFAGVQLVGEGGGGDVGIRPAHRKVEARPAGAAGGLGALVRRLGLRARRREVGALPLDANGLGAGGRHEEAGQGRGERKGLENRSHDVLPHGGSQSREKGFSRV
jgi:hypothetical protein